jgi:hypothetical protein
MKEITTQGFAVLPPRKRLADGPLDLCRSRGSLCDASIHHIHPSVNLTFAID